MAAYLLDTHTLLWSLSAPERLQDNAQRAIQNASNAVFVSAASVWEMAIKAALGKLKTPDDLEEQLRLNRFEALPIKLAHAQAAGQLPPHHRDPFDRMLIAQALHEGLTLITRDALVQQYAVRWIPA